ncbi:MULTISPECIES: type IV pilus biogenesis protein PilP [unclassified Serratia (in: enterobacteria)]|uniref:type IV pilus biogenesis protein PilP n=1 Tax=unclassified Serratia (in: enterobacteria) TaxID=2647522 RepID=UPI0030760BB2
MPTVKYRAIPWALGLAMTVVGGFAAPITAVPAAPAALPSTASAAPITPMTSDTPSPSSPFTRADVGRTLDLGQLESIQAETVLYEAQLIRAKALSELQKNGYDRSLDLPFNPAPPSQEGHSAVKGAMPEAGPPQILEITGNKRGFMAVLVLGNGNQVTVQTGNRVPGTDYVVKRITLNEVVVSGQNTALVSLAFARG